MNLLYRRRLLNKQWYKTTLFTDGTFIINEKAIDRPANILLHGAVTNEYPPLDENNPYVFNSANEDPWVNERASITRVEFGSEVKPTSLSQWFNNAINLSSFDSTNLNTSNVSSMRSMFYKCLSLVSLDISSWNTTNNTTCENMFNLCSSLTTLILPEHFVTSSCSTIVSIFDGCSSLTAVDVSDWDVSGCTSLSRAFRGCSTLTSLGLSNWSTVNADSMRSMFDNCSSLTSLDLSNFDTTYVTDIYYMFNACSSLTSLDLSNFNMSSSVGLIMNRTFGDCSNLISLVIGTIDSNYNISTSSNCFNNCSNLARITINGLNVLKLTNSNALSGLKADCQIKVPADLVDSYKSATNWSARAAYISAI